MWAAANSNWLYCPDREEERQNNTQAVLQALNFYDDHLNKQKEDDHGAKFMESFMEESELSEDEKEWESDSPKQGKTMLVVWHFRPFSNYYTNSFSACASIGTYHLWSIFYLSCYQMSK